jgi:hypothetical protein
MRVRAISLASARSNVVGALEIECSTDGLSVTYVDAALLSDQGIPVAIDAGRSVSVPWSQVRDARVLGDAVAFEIDPAPWPPQRLLLVRFEATQSTSPHRVYRRRLVARVIGLASSIVVAITGSIVVPRVWNETGWRIALCAGAALGLSVVGCALMIDGLIATGGLRSRIVRELFIDELLGLVPGLPREPTAVATKNIRWPRMGGVVPRATLAVSLVLASLVLVAVATPRTNAAQGGLAVAPPQDTSSSPPPAEAPVPTAPFVQVVGPCECPRDEGPLGNEPLPRVSMLTVSSRTYQRAGRSHVELELAAVNNGSRDISDLATVIEFSQGDKEPWSKPVNVSVRAVFHKTLASGAAVKWHVDAEGETVRIRTPTSRGVLIDGSVRHDGEGAAPTSAIAELLDARSMPVRLHGAMVLAFLDDAHAREALTKLADSLDNGEKVYVTRLIEAVGMLRTCRIAIADEGLRRRLSACITNATDQRAAGIDVTFRALDKPAALRSPQDPAPDVLAEWSLGMPGGIEPKQGVEVHADVDLAAISRSQLTFEAVARRAASKPQ